MGAIAAFSRFGRVGGRGRGRAYHHPSSVGDAASLLLDLLRSNLTALLHSTALHCGAADSEEGGEGMEVGDDVTVQRMAAEAEAEAMVREPSPPELNEPSDGEGRGGGASIREGDSRGEVAEARQRLEREKGLLLILGLLYFSTAESKAVCAALAEVRERGGAGRGEAREGRSNGQRREVEKSVKGGKKGAQRSAAQGREGAERREGGEWGGGERRHAGEGMDGGVGGMRERGGKGQKRGQGRAREWRGGQAEGRLRGGDGVGEGEGL